MTKQSISLRDAFRNGIGKKTTLDLTLAILLGSERAFSRATSIRRGYDVYYQPGTRPLSPRRYVTDGLEIILSATRVVLGARELVTRRNDTSSTSARYGKHNQATGDLAFELTAHSLAAALFARELKTGASLYRKHPRSAYGRAISATALAVTTYEIARSIHELYARRDQWLPGVVAKSEQLRSSLPHSLRGR